MASAFHGHLRPTVSSSAGRAASLFPLPMTRTLLFLLNPARSSRRRGLGQGGTEPQLPLTHRHLWKFHVSGSCSPSPCQNQGRALGTCTPSWSPMLFLLLWSWRRGRVLNPNALPGRGLVGKAGYRSTVRPSKIIRGAAGCQARGALGTCSSHEERCWELGKGRRGVGSPLAL